MKLKPIKDIQLKKDMNLDNFVKKLHESGGFTAKKLSVGVDILENMIKDNNCINFL